MQKLMEEMKDNLSPQAVAIIIAHLQTVNFDSAAAMEVLAFRTELESLVGSELGNLFDEVGV